MKLTVQEIASVNRTVTESEFTFSRFGSMHELPFIGRAIAQSMYPLAMRFIIVPISLIRCTIIQHHFALADCNVAIGLALILSLVFAIEFNGSHRLIVFIIDRKLGAIWPSQFRLAMPTTAFELALQCDSVTKLNKLNAAEIVVRIRA